MILEKQKIAFIHIPKCGGSSIEQMLHDTFGDGGRLWSDKNRKLYRIGESRQHWTLQEVRNRFDLKGWKVFTVVRNPIERARSEFYYQIRENKKCLGLKPYRDGDLGSAIKSDLLFRRCYPTHHLSASDFLKLKQKDVELEVLRLEHIQEDLLKLGEKWGIKWADLKVINPTKVKKGWDWGQDEFYELEGRWPDFHIGGYKTPYPVFQHKKIYMFWEQGWENAPRIAKASIKSWRILNPEWEVVALDGNSPVYSKVKPLWGDRNLKPCHKADLLRMWLMANRGGVWADATTLCLKPLRSWLNQALGTERFFIFRNHPVANWFIASDQGSDLAVEWLRRSKNYWKGRRSEDRYMWPHYLFGKMMDEGLAENMVDICASDWVKAGPHMMLPYHSDLNGPAGPNFFPRLIAESPPMLKLTRHHEVNPGSKYDWLLSSFEEKHK